MPFSRRLLLLSTSVLTAALLAGCECATPAPTDAGRDAPVAVDVPRAVDAPVIPDDVRLDVPEDAASAPTCLDRGYEVGERYPAGSPWDGCNFCECRADGSEVCTERLCPDSIGGCTYEGVGHDYGERFPSADGCNECVCAASGLACTVRAGCTEVPSSAILLESANARCGDNPDFTPASVLGGLMARDVAVPFHYDRERTFVPEVLPDTTLRLRIVYEGGFLVCRIPSPDQPALDIQASLEWITEDGAFDEGFPAYIRRNDFGFLDTWMMVGGVPLGALEGSYTPICTIDPGDYGFEAQVTPEGYVYGSVSRLCETDILVNVGTFDTRPPTP